MGIAPQGGVSITFTYRFEGVLTLTTSTYTLQTVNMITYPGIGENTDTFTQSGSYEVSGSRITFTESGTDTPEIVFLDVSANGTQLTFEQDGVRVLFGRR